MYTDPPNKMLMDAWAGGRFCFKKTEGLIFLCPYHLLSISSGAPCPFGGHSHLAGKRWAVFNPEECRDAAPIRASQAAGLARGRGLSPLQPYPQEAAPDRASIPALTAGVETAPWVPGERQQVCGAGGQRQEGQSASGGINGDISFRLISCYIRITRPSTTGSSWAFWQGNKWTPKAWGRLSKPCASRHPSSGSGEGRVSCTRPFAEEGSTVVSSTSKRSRLCCAKSDACPGTGCQGPGQVTSSSKSNHCSAMAQRWLVPTTCWERLRTPFPGQCSLIARHNCNTEQSPATLLA